MIVKAIQCNEKAHDDDDAENNSMIWREETIPLMIWTNEENHKEEEAQQANNCGKFWSDGQV